MRFTHALLLAAASFLDGRFPSGTTYFASLPPTNTGGKMRISASATNCTIWICGYSTRRQQARTTCFTARPWSRTRCTTGNGNIRPTRGSRKTFSSSRNCTRAFTRTTATPPHPARALAVRSLWGRRATAWLAKNQLRRRFEVGEPLHREVRSRSKAFSQRGLSLKRAFMSVSSAAIVLGIAAGTVAAAPATKPSTAKKPGARGQEKKRPRSSRSGSKKSKTCSKSPHRAMNTSDA